MTAKENAGYLPLIPREVLFGNPETVGPTVSPDGKRLAYLAPVNNVLNVWVGNVKDKDFRPVTDDKDRGIHHYFWSYDDRHLLYLQDIGGNENWRLYAVDLVEGKMRCLTPFDDVQVQIVEHNKHFPEEILIAMNRENPQVHDVYHLHLPSGEMKLIAKNPGNIAGWVTDPSLQVRGRVAATPDGGFEFHVRKDSENSWEKLIEWDQEDSLASGPLCFSKDGTSVYLKDSRNSNAARLVQFHIATLQTVVLASDPEYDVSHVIVHPDRYDIQAVGFTKDRDEWTVLDSSIGPDIAKIRDLHPGDFFLSSRDRDDHLWIVGFTADDGPVPYYFFDRSTGEATFLFHHRPELGKYTLAPMEPISYQSRDGWTIHGYLTLPPASARTKLPLVLNVHGGPWHRDTWGFDPEAQWLANRGYACLQVNFRGSTGYGKKFLNAGDREWGRRMHDDLVDAVRWAIDQGIADPKRLAIYGGSYGGYAALVGATFTPDLFRCAVDIVGPSNLITFIRSIPPYWSTFLSLLHKRLGNPDTEEDYLISRSPLFKVDQIRIPMLIAQGANDPRVKQAESEQIVGAMKEKGIDYEYLLFEDEGHGFAKPENRLRFYRVAEQFLARHLGGRCESDANPTKLEDTQRK